MKKRYITFTLILLSVFICTTLASAQNCRKFHLYGACMQHPGYGYKIDGQSRSNIIGFGDKLIYNVIFYGSRNYQLFFCASSEFNPVHFRLTDSETGDVIFDNSENDYIETVEFTLQRTRNLKIEISVLAHNATEEFLKGFLGCSGILIYWKPASP